MRKASKGQVLRDGYRQIRSSVGDLLTLRNILEIQMEILCGQMNTQNWNQDKGQAGNIYFGVVIVYCHCMLSLYVFKTTKPSKVFQGAGIDRREKKAIF